VNILWCILNSGTFGFKHALAFVGKRAALPLGLLTVGPCCPGMVPPPRDTNVRSLTERLAWADYAFISAWSSARVARRIVARARGGLRSLPAVRCSTANTSSSKQWTLHIERG